MVRITPVRLISSGTQKKGTAEKKAAAPEIKDAVQKKESSKSVSFKNKIPQKGDVSFKGWSASAHKLYQKLLPAHFDAMVATNPQKAETLLKKLGIEAKFNTPDELTNSILAYCTVKTAGIFKQLGLALPPKIDTLAHEHMKSVYGMCLGAETKLGGKILPSRSILINEVIPLTTPAPWSHIDVAAAENFAANHSSSRHFLGVFIHEFAHSAHFANFFKRHKCYDIKFFKKVLNEEKANEIAKNIKSKPMPDAYLVAKNISSYAATNPFEKVAEKMTKIITEEHNLDFNSLRLKRNPF